MPAILANLKFFWNPSPSLPISALFSLLTFLTAPGLHLIWTMPINRFQISWGYFEPGRGEPGVSHSHTARTHKLPFSVHLSFDNKNTSFKLSGHQKNESQGNRIKLHVLGGSVSDSNNNNANLVFFNGKILRAALWQTGINSQERGLLLGSQLCVCISLPANS